MQRHITYDTVLSEFINRGYELVSTEYLGYNKKLQYICATHRDKGIQEMTFANFTQGKNCPYCSKRKKRTNEEYIKDLHEIFPHIVPLEEYQGLKIKILHKCNICGYEWKAVPTNFLHLHEGCPKCNKRHYKRTQQEFELEIKKLDSNIEVLDTFTKVATKIRFKCNKCGHIWEAKPNNILSGRGCPHCNISYGEKKIAKWLENNHIEYKSQYIFKDCKNILELPFDFYIPERNLCIEYDGEQHFKPCRFGGISLEQAKNNMEECQKRDKIKTDYCENNNIKLLRINYKQFKEIDKILLLNFN